MSAPRQVDPAAAAELFIIQDQVHEPMHDRFLWATMQRRHAEAAAIPEWEELREIASKIKSIRSPISITISRNLRPTPQSAPGCWRRAFREPNSEGLHRRGQQLGGAKRAKGPSNIAVGWGIVVPPEKAKPGADGVIDADAGGA